VNSEERLTYVVEELARTGRVAEVKRRLAGVVAELTAK
jgi:hypothetical protein